MAFPQYNPLEIECKTQRDTAYLCVALLLQIPFYAILSILLSIRGAIFRKDDALEKAQLIPQ